MNAEELSKKDKDYIDYFITHYEKNNYLFHSIDHNYDNIKFADTKAQVLLAGVVLLLTILGIKEKGVLEVWEAINLVTLYIGRVTIIGFLCSLIVCLWFSFLIISPRYRLPASWEASLKDEESKGTTSNQRRFSPPRLFWSQNIISYKDPAFYFHAVEQLNEDSIIQDLSHEIYKLSGILNEKLIQLGRATKGFFALLIFWTILIVLIWFG